MRPKRQNQKRKNLIPNWLYQLLRCRYQIERPHYHTPDSLLPYERQAIRCERYIHLGKGHR